MRGFLAIGQDGVVVLGQFGNVVTEGLGLRLGGGQFGGFSGPDGMGVAVRSLCHVLDYVGIGYHLRDFADIQAARGF